MKELLDALDAKGVRLRVHEGRVIFVAPRGALTPDLLRALRAKRAALADHVRLQAGGQLGAATFDPERLLEQAFEAAGHDDLGPEPAPLREALGVFCESLERDAALNGVGRVFALERLIQLGLSNRLRLAPTLRAQARPRLGPLVVCGLPRSGTTLLHRLLSLAEGGEGIPLWRLMEPIPPAEGPDGREERARRNVDWFRGLAREDLDAQHELRVELPEECAYLFQMSFFGNQLWKLPAAGWLRWWMHADGGPAYRAWAAALSVLERPDTRLVLKDPFHAPWLDALFAVAPDAMVVQTHRDPIEVLPSLHKLCRTSHQIFSDQVDPAVTVPLQTEWLETLIHRNEAARPRLPAGRLLDLQYRALVDDPLAAAARVHAHFGLPLSEADEARMGDWLAANPKGRFGVNRYSLEAFGQRPEAIAERFAAYRARRLTGDGEA